MQLKQQQQEAFNAIHEFVADTDKSIFILKGYAGTGKTTMIKSVIPMLVSFGKKVHIMAPTGRAAKELRKKTGYDACTIHRGIYAFENMQAVRYDDNGNLIETKYTKNKELRSKGSDDLQFWFAIRKHELEDDPSKDIYIIDESSMVGSMPTINESLHFGTDVLIDDLLTYARLHLGGKIIFVGDPAQLPPVGDNKSVALSESFFENKSLGVSSYELTEVLRQDRESTILKNAMMIRDLLGIDHRNQLFFERENGEVEDITPEQVVDSFYENAPTPSVGNSIIICYTNSLARDYNEAVRRRYFPDSEGVMPGDILQVVKNNVNTDLGIELFNGDFVKVLSVSKEVDIQSAPVWTDNVGKREKVTIRIEFRDAVLLGEDGTQIKCKIVDSLLNSREPNLTLLQTVALYINFRLRHPEIRKDEEAFAEALKNDPYFNAVQVKYGYAITGHKSQGGEWHTAYVDYSGRSGLNNDSLRWAYTATTRASNVLFGVNMPSITAMSALKFNTITKAGKASKEAFLFADVDDVEFLPNTASAAQKQKCICVKKQLDEKGFLLKSIQSFQYNDKYTIDTPSGTVVFNCYYNGAGQYTRFSPESVLPENDELFAIFENEKGMRYSIEYKPSSDALKQLYHKVQSICDDLEIVITNIVEHTTQYYVMYYLKTSGKFSQVQFYFKANYSITHALPASDLGNADDKLVKFIESFK